MNEAAIAALVREQIDRHPLAVALKVLGNRLRFGVGSPAGAVAAPVGTIWLRTDGGAATTLYVKESGTGTAGWVAK